VRWGYVIQPPLNISLPPSLERRGKRKSDREKVIKNEGMSTEKSEAHLEFYGRYFGGNAVGRRETSPLRGEGRERVLDE